MKSKLIYSSSPKDWKDLQNKVAAIFEDIGCKVAIEKNIQTARDTVNVDVFVEDTTNVPPSIYLCECKFWDRPIPKKEVHAFRTVVSDFGAHHGFLISKKGFQDGARDARNWSNVHVVDWDQFQKEIYPRWIDSMVEKVKLQTRRIVQSSDPEIKEGSETSLAPNDLQKHHELLLRGLQFSASMMDTMSVIKEIIPPLTIFDFSTSDKSTISFESKKDFFEFVLYNTELLINDINKLFGGSRN